MIAIVGTNHDDILYFETAMANKKEDLLLKKYKITIGTIFNQEVLLIHGLNTSILSSVLVSTICSKYYIDLIIAVGRCFAMNKGLKVGDIIIAEKVINIDVDQIDDNDVRLGQIPSLPQEFKVQQDVIGYIEEGLNKRAFTTGKRVSVLSSNDLSNNTLRRIRENVVSIFDLNKTVVDSISGGVAVSAYLYNVPFVSVKVVEKIVGEKWNIDNYLKVLDSYVGADKAIIAAIGDIGRNDVIIGGHH